MENIKELIDTKQFKIIQENLNSLHVVDIAEIIDELETPNQTIVFRLLPKELAAEVFSYLSIEKQLEIVNSIRFEELQPILDDLYLDDKVDLLMELPANAVKRILKNTSPEERKLINQFLNYKEKTAGSIMTSEYVALTIDMTVGDALQYIRKNGMDKETIYNCYVISAHRRLLGVVSLRELVIADRSEFIKDIMIEDVIFVHTDTDQEIVSDEFSKYDFIALPVVDTEGRMTGIVTVDDILDIREEETTEDFQKMAAMAPSEGLYLEESPVKLAKDRLLWLVILMISGTFTGNIIGNYSWILAQYLVLNSFLPMLTGASGNAGIQSSTLAVRNLALEEINFTNFWKVTLKEVQVGVMVGVLMAAASFTKVMLIDRVSVSIGLVVVVTMFVAILVAKVFGGMIPLIAERFKIDPAIMSSSIITTIVDAVAIIIYFAIAAALLPV